jgi:Uma2 family endonuclease
MPVSVIIRQMRFPAPDFIAEILSPSTEENDRNIKSTDYAAHGVSEYWIIDPAYRIVEQYLLEKNRFGHIDKLCSE